MNTVFRQYRLVLLPLALVLMLDLFLLAVNYHLSSELEVSSVNINIAGRQRMLSQRMTKSLALQHYKTTQGLAFQSDRSEMIKSVRLFDQTLSAFYDGGKATSADGKAILVARLKPAEIRNTLEKAKNIWDPTLRQLNNYFNYNPVEKTATEKLIGLLSVNNLKLLNHMNELTIQLEQDAKRKTYILKGLQTAIVIVILLSFALATVRLFRREKYYNNLMEKSTDVVVGVDVQTGETTFVSSSIHEVLGYRVEHVVGKPFVSLFTTQSKEIILDILDLVVKTGQLEKDRCEAILLKHSGQTMVVDMVMQLAASEDGKSQELSVDIRDISERKEAELALMELAHKDELTGLFNRKSFLDLADHSIKRAERFKDKIAIMFIDLDGFKGVNDSFGHRTGDLLLKELAMRLISCVRASDCVARVGGDEFLILLENVNDESEIKDLAAKIISTLSQRIDIEGEIVQLGASIGISVFPEKGTTVNELINKADQAMYEIKNSGKNNFAFA